MPAVLLVTTGTSRGSDEITTSTTRLYLDPRTLLPIASDVTGTYDYGVVEPFSGEGSYEHEWIDRDSLPADFFTPDSIGYVGATDPEAQLEDLDPGTPVYWLGADYPGTAELPALRLRQAAAPARTPYRIELTYGEPGPVLRPVLSLQEFSVTQWEALSGSVPCANLQSDESLSDRTIEVYRCSEGVQDKYQSVVYIADTVILVSPLLLAQSDDVNPYSSVEAMRRVATDLVLR